jgi:CubicO group peptidase (beta-lactamase class C family)
VAATVEPVEARTRGRQVVRILSFGLAGLVSLIVLWLVGAMVIYSPTYVGRVLSMRESDQNDYLENFPVRTLRASPEPRPYAAAPSDEAAARMATALGATDLDRFLADTDSQALLVIQGDALVVERYANGAERDTMLTSFSVAKSFDSTLVGIAIDEGLIGSVDDPIVAYLPELAERVDDDPRLAEITIADLLSMASGLEYRENRWALFNGDDPITTYHPDQRKMAIEAATRIEDEPGRYFRYNKYHPQLLGMILERATGMTVTEYTRTRLWDPLGMEYEGQWTLDSEDEGFEKMEAGLNARAIDFAKLGSLYLADGEWNGHRVVSTQWVEAATGPTPDRLDPGRYRDDFGRWIHRDGAGWYGWFWYGRARSGADPDVFAEGDHGQFIYVCPATDTVIVRLGTAYGLDPGVWVDAFTAYCDGGPVSG